MAQARREGWERRPRRAGSRLRSFTASSGNPRKDAGKDRRRATGSQRRARPPHPCPLSARGEGTREQCARRLASGVPSPLGERDRVRGAFSKPPHPPRGAPDRLAREIFPRRFAKLRGGREMDEAVAPIVRGTAINARRLARLPIRYASAACKSSGPASPFKPPRLRAEAVRRSARAYFRCRRL